MFHSVGSGKAGVGLIISALALLYGTEAGLKVQTRMRLVVYSSPAELAQPCVAKDSSTGHEETKRKKLLVGGAWLFDGVDTGLELGA